MKNGFLSPMLLAVLSGMASAATVDLASNSVKAGGSKLKTGAQVSNGSEIATGSKSKLQIALGGSGGTLRAGSKTNAVLDSDQELSLKKGILLTSSGGKGMGRESLSVNTPETRISAKGTMLVAYQPDTYIKITCIEGRVSVKLKALLGEFVTLRPGQMVIINPADKGLPESVEVDLKELAATCALLGSDYPALGSENSLSTAAARQARAVRGGDLAQTNLRLIGAGPAVSLQLGIEGQRQPEPEPEATPPARPAIPPVKREGGGGGGGGEGGGEVVIPTPPDGYVIDESTTFDPSAPSLTTPDYPTITGVTSPSNQTLYMFPPGTVAPSLTILGNVLIPSDSYGTTYFADGPLLVGDGKNPVSVQSENALSLHGLVEFISRSAISSPGDVLLSAQELTLSDSSVVSKSHLSLFGTTIVTVSNSKLTGDFGLLIGSGGAISITGSDLDSNEEVLIGNADPLSSAPITISRSTILTAGYIDIYSNSAAAYAISVSDSTLTSTQPESAGFHSVQIGNDEASGGKFYGGISIATSTITGTNDIGVQTGVTGPGDVGTILIDRSTLQSTAGSVNIVNKSSNGSQVGIRIQNSSQLLALASLGSVRLTTNGSQIYVSDASTLSGGSGGEVLIDAMAGASPVDTLVQLDNLNVNADVIRARAFNSADRDALVINGGRYDAATMLKFYAEGASRLRFTGNVALNTPDAVLAGKIVQVDAGGTVTGSGRVSVYSDDHRYNTRGFGDIRLGSGGTNGPGRGTFAERPGF